MTAPFSALLDQIRTSLKSENQALVIAPPGTGKTTLLPSALLKEHWVQDRLIIVLEPRRLAARASARFVARGLKSKVGELIGYRVRMDSKSSKATRILYMTEGVFIRQIQQDPELSNVAAVIFDEFHERHLDSDLSLALVLETQSALRPDLRVIVMSATLDVMPVKNLLLRALVHQAEAAPFPIETIHVSPKSGEPVDAQIATTLLGALEKHEGSILAFLPGQAEIKRCMARLEGPLRDRNIDLLPLYGGLSATEQDKAIAPSNAGGRKIVLATAIAQTSLTIEGVSIVIDSGLDRRPKYDPRTGLTSLATERVSQATAKQREGRAGRLGPGVCYRLWERGQTRSFPPYDPPEILNCDLAPMALHLAAWGVPDPNSLSWLDKPPHAAFEQAKVLLRDLEALAPDGQLTALGKHLVSLPLHPRLSAMLMKAGKYGEARRAALIAALVSEPNYGRKLVDVEERLLRLEKDKSPVASSLKREARRWLSYLPHGADKGTGELGVGALLSLAYPDRIGVRRHHGHGLFHLSNGRGAFIGETEHLAKENMIVVQEVSGSGENSRIISAAAIARSEFELLHSKKISQDLECDFDEKSRSVSGRLVKKLGSLILGTAVARVSDEQRISSFISALYEHGLDILPWSYQGILWRTRVRFALGETDDQKKIEHDVMGNLESWLAPLLLNIKSLYDIAPDALLNAYKSNYSWDEQQCVELAAPSHFTAPTGSRIAIDYEAEQGPTVSIRLQELFGVKEHPVIGERKHPLIMNLLSPARRSIQVTQDLPGFWSGSYRQVRAEMRGRYPKHFWPERPEEEIPTRRAKPRR